MHDKKGNVLLEVDPLSVSFGTLPDLISHAQQWLPVKEDLHCYAETVSRPHIQRDTWDLDDIRVFALSLPLKDRKGRDFALNVDEPADEFELKS